MAKHTQTIRQQQPTNCLSVFDHIVEGYSQGYKSFKENSNIGYKYEYPSKRTICFVLAFNN